MTRHVALLRAVNVGGRGKVSMVDLRNLAEGIGLAEIATVLQSGSLAFSDDGKGPALERRLEDELQEKLGLRTAVVVRSAERWRRIVAANPFPAAADSDPSHLVVLAGKRAMKAAAEKTVLGAIKGREQVSVNGDVAYVLYPDGIGRSKLTNAVLERHLETAVTGRNWNTVLKIADLLGVAPGLSA